MKYCGIKWSNAISFIFSSFFFAASAAAPFGHFDRKPRPKTQSKTVNKAHNNECMTCILFWLFPASSLTFLHNMNMYECNTKKCSVFSHIFLLMVCFCTHKMFSLFLAKMRITSFFLLKWKQKIQKKCLLSDFLLNRSNQVEFSYWAVFL